MYHSDRGGVERDAIANSFCYEASSGVLPSGKLLQNSKLLLICDDPICVVIPLIQAFCTNWSIKCVPGDLHEDVFRTGHYSCKIYVEDPNKRMAHEKRPRRLHCKFFLPAACSILSHI